MPPTKQNAYNTSNGRIRLDANDPTCEYVYLKWEDIEFDANKITIKANNVPKIYPAIALKGSLPVLNKIKDVYFERLFPEVVLKFCFVKGIIDETRSTGCRKILEMIEPAKEYFAFRYENNKTRNRIGNFKKHSKEQVRTLFADVILRNPYFKWLAEKHDPAFKLIPIIEYQNGFLEESFIFLFRAGTGRILITWENPTPGRATYQFISKEEELQQQLEKIESYVINAIDGKRDLLNDQNNPESKKLRKELLYTNEKILHNSFSSFKTNIQVNISRY